MSSTARKIRRNQLKFLTGSRSFRGRVGKFQGARRKFYQSISERIHNAFGLYSKPTQDIRPKGKSVFGRLIGRILK